MVRETKSGIQHVDPVTGVAARGDELVTATALRLCDHTLDEGGANLTASMIGFDEHVFQQSEWALVKLIGHYI